jgi:ABC-type sugar transport system ATPase subunit
MPKDKVAPEAILIEGISKHFGGTKALDNVSLRLQPGTIHALVGQNGCGKSTLIKILSGYYTPDPGGRILVGGRELSLPLTPTASADEGFAFVHQDLGLGESLSVMENVCVGALVTNRWGRVKWKAMRELVHNLLRDLGSSVHPDTPVAELSQAERTGVAMARALFARGRNAARLLVLDEPTAYLPPAEVQKIFVTVRRAAALGAAVVFVTHRLDEVVEITDEVTVLRDGKHVLTAVTSSMTQNDIIEAILGRSLGELYPSRLSNSNDRVLMSVRGLTGESVRDLSFDLHEGEVLGVTGLAGMGQDEVPYLLVGSVKPKRGELTFDGVTTGRLNPLKANQLGIGLLPANRTTDSGVPTASIRENLTSVSLGEFISGGGRLNHRAEKARTLATIKEYDVRPGGDSEALLGSLSGGNQQKVLVAKWLRMPHLRCMIMHEPAQGIDVSAKKSVLTLVKEVASRGVAVILVSSEHEDLAHLCDRVLVVREGELCAEVTSESMTADRIAELCYAS